MVELLGKHPTFRAIDDEEDREEIYYEMLQARSKLRVAREKKNLEQDSKELKGLFSKLEIPFYMKWRDALSILLDSEVYKGNQRFQRMHLVDKLAAFESYIRDLETENALKKQNERDAKLRMERKAREEFRDFLRKQKISFDTKWEEVFPLAREQNSFIILSDSMGSQPIDLFRDIVDAQFIELCKLKDRVLHSLSIDVKESKFEEFSETVRKTKEFLDLDEKTIRAIFEELKNDLNFSQPGTEEYENARKIFKSFLTKFSAIKHDSKWEDIQKLMRGNPAYDLFPDEEEKKVMFGKRIKRLQEKRTMHQEQEEGEVVPDSPPHKRRYSRSPRRSRSRHRSSSRKYARHYSPQRSRDRSRSRPSHSPRR